ncbi:MAG: hypothetical protein ACKKL6_04130 [Candidatus Komeilibacteria bacterium]
MEKLYNTFAFLVEANWFKRVMDVTVFLNPVAIAPQIWSAFTAPSVEGISVGMWLIFAGIQLAFVFQGIKHKSASMFLSMLLSLMETSTIIAVVLVRG